MTKTFEPTGTENDLSSISLSDPGKHRSAFVAIQSNMSVHHYECVALCFVNILQRARS